VAAVVIHQITRFLATVHLVVAVVRVLVVALLLAAQELQTKDLKVVIVQ
jgi:hypothetical protein